MWVSLRLEYLPSGRSPKPHSDPQRTAPSRHASQSQLLEDRSHASKLVDTPPIVAVDTGGLIDLRMRCAHLSESVPIRLHDRWI